MNQSQVHGDLENNLERLQRELTSTRCVSTGRHYKALCEVAKLETDLLSEPRQQEKCISNAKPPNKEDVQ